jgi:RNA polymerase subunit RPABC4/transcription elongation factor Spt4
VTRAYTEAGTFGYIAPEQAYGRARFSSDVFSLGLIAYEVLTGFLPTWPFEWPPERYRTFTAKVPEPARPVLRKAAQFDPSRRYTDGQQFSDALEHAFAEVEAHAQTAPRRRRKPRLPELSPLAVQAEAFRRGHGRGLELLYRCHRCDGPIAEPMKHCPWCGSAGNSFAHLTSAALVCPDCEKGVRPEWKACPWCYAGRFEGNGRRPPRDPESGARVQHARLRGSAAPVHALLPAVQAQGEARLVARRPARPLPALPLADVARLLPLLPVVRAPRTARGELPRALVARGRPRPLPEVRALLCALLHQDEDVPVWVLEPGRLETADLGDPAGEEAHAARFQVRASRGDVFADEADV